MLDAEGRNTNDPVEALRGVVLPIGGPKGSGIAMMLDIFGGLLTGSAYSGDVRDQYQDFENPQGVGHWFMVFRPEMFLDSKEQYLQRKNSRSRRNRAPGSFSSASQSQESSNSSTDESDSKVVTSDTKDKQHGTDGGSEVLCHRLGFSSRDMMSTSATNRMNNESLTIPAALLSDLAARYPQGNIFHLNFVVIKFPYSSSSFLLLGRPCLRQAKAAHD